MKTKNKQEVYNSSLLDELLSEITPEEQEKTNKRMMLAAKIAAAIKAKGWKKSEFAERMGKYPSDVSKWLSGTHNFETDTLFEIEKVLGVDLFTWKEKEPIYIIKEVHYTEVRKLEKPVQYFGGMSRLITAMQITGNISTKDERYTESSLNLS